VQIKRFNGIASTIELTKKTLQIDDKQEAHKQQSMEALTCSCEHLGITNFPTIHTQRPWKRTHCGGMGGLFEKC